MSFKAGALSVLTLLLSAGLASAAPAVISATSLNLRAGPGAEHRIVANMPRGARVEIVNCGPDWCRLRFRGFSGFALATHLDRGDGGHALASAAPIPAIAWSNPSPEPDARVWRWKDPQWRHRHARTGQWLRRHGR